MSSAVGPHRIWDDAELHISRGFDLHVVDARRLFPRQKWDEVWRVPIGATFRRHAALGVTVCE